MLPRDPCSRCLSRLLFALHKRFPRCSFVSLGKIARSSRRIAWPSWCFSLYRLNYKFDLNLYIDCFLMGLPIQWWLFVEFSRSRVLFGFHVRFIATGLTVAELTVLSLLAQVTWSFVTDHVLRAACLVLWLSGGSVGRRGGIISSTTIH